MSVEWYHARDVFLGRNYEHQDLTLGLELASKCPNDKDAVWLCSLFPITCPTNTQDARAVFLAAQVPGDKGRALCFAACMLIGTRQSIVARDELVQAGTLGYALAQVHDAICTDTRSFREEAFQQGERDAIALVAQDVGSEYAALVGSEYAALAKKAALLGSKVCQYLHGISAFGPFDRERYQWIGKAASKGCFIALNRLTNELYENHNVLIAYRAAEQIVRFKKSWYTNHQGHDSGHNMASLLYNTTQEAAKSAIRYWLFASKELGMVRDIRILIGKKLLFDAHEWVK